MLATTLVSLGPRGRRAGSHCQHLRSLTIILILFSGFVPLPSVCVSNHSLLYYYYYYFVCFIWFWFLIFF